MQIFTYFSDLLDRRVVDKDNVAVGVLHDVSMRVGEEIYPRSDRIIIKKGFGKKKFASIPMEEVEQINGGIRLKIPHSQIQYQDSRIKNDFTLRADILDQQVVDIDNQKVVRVNDVHLLKIDKQMYLAHVDVGLRSLIRRLEWTKGVDALVRLFAPESPYLKKEELISWKNTQVLTIGRTKNVLRLAVARQKLSQIPPTEMAEIMESLDKYEKHSFFKSLDISTQQKVFADLAIKEKEDLIDQLEDKETVSLLENIPADEATDVLTSLPKEKTRQLMRLMENKTSKKLRKLLGFAQDSAGGLMTTEYLSLPDSATVADALSKIKESIQYSGNIYHVYLLDEQGRMVGATALRRFIAVDGDVPLKETCYPKKIFVRTDDGMEEVALLLEKYKFSSIPVLDENDVMQGVITNDDVMEELISLIWGKYKEKL